MQAAVRNISAGFGTIVVATDFSEFAARALLKAVELAHRSGSKIVLAHVIDPLTHANALNSAPFIPRQIERNARQRLEVAAEVLRHKRIPHELVVREGITRDVLCQLVEDLKADLLVVGTHGESRFDRDVVGSVAEKILRVAPCPVMTVGYHAADVAAAGTGPQRILIATGLTAHSLRALPFADALAHHLGAEIHLLHVVLPAADKPEVARKCMEELEQMARIHVHLTQRVHCLVQRGELGETIAAVARSLGAVATVLGVQEENLQKTPNGGLNHGLIYSIVTQVGCPVITLHSGLNRKSLHAGVPDGILLST